MRLECSKDELNNLISHQIVEPRGDNKFVINTKPNLVGKTIQIPIEYVNVESSGDDLIEKNVTVKNVEDWYTEYRKSFPIDIEKAIGNEHSEGTNLRTGKKDKIIKKLKDLAEVGYDLNNVIAAVKYEIWWRVNETIKDGKKDNKLQYMRRMEAWINDTENLDTMIERATKSNDFQKVLNGNNGTEPTRKVKIV